MNIKWDYEKYEGMNMDKNERLAAELEYRVEVSLPIFHKRLEDVSIKTMSVWSNLCEKEDNVYADVLNTPSETVEKISKIMFDMRILRDELQTTIYNIKSLFGSYESEELFNKIRNDCEEE